MSGAPEHVDLKHLGVAEAGGGNGGRLLANSADEPHASAITETFEQIVQEALTQPGFLGVMMATAEPDEVLAIRATAGLMDPRHFHEVALKAGVRSVSPERLPRLSDAEHHVGARLLFRQDPHDPQPILTDRLHDLFGPSLDPEDAKAIQQAAGITHMVILPIIVDGKVAGGLFALSTTPFSRNHLRLLGVLARQAGSALLSQRFVSDMEAITHIVGAPQMDSTAEEKILDRTVGVLVEDLRYPAALIASLEDGNALLLRTCAVEGSEAVRTVLAPQLRRLLREVQVLGLLDDPQYEHNIAVRALRGHPEDSPTAIESDLLYDLLRPHVSEEKAAKIQRQSLVRSVLAVPFALAEEVTGTLLIASYRRAFLPRERRLLTAVAQQAALGIRNARLYWRVEEQRRVAQTFARMAFSASAYLHTLRNRIGSFRTYLGLIQVLPHLDSQQQEEIIATGRKAYQGLDEAAEILDHLHEPWRQHPDVPTSVNDCLRTAMLKLFPKLKLKRNRDSSEVNGGITVHWTLAEDLPAIQTSPDMLSEAFRIIIRNAVDSLQEKRDAGTEVTKNLWIASEAVGDDVVEVTVRDDGIGIPPGNIRRIFELGWSTKQGKGMGFGLFWARNFIEGLGGSIEVESVPQQGASFRFILPIDEDE